MKTEKIIKIIFALLIIGIGLFAISIASIWIASPSPSCEYVWYKSYGGDAYTGIQNATADTANNVYAAALELNSINICIGFIFLTLGLCITIYGIYFLIFPIIDLCKELKKTRAELEKTIEALRAQNAQINKE